MNWENSEVNLRIYKGYRLVRTDPYGFWRIESAVDEVVMNQEFTMVTLAQKAVDAYLEKLPEKPAEVKKKRK